MNKHQESQKIKIYYDIGMLKGNTFEQSINTVNKLYLGLGLKISEVPYIYISENDKKIYLAANCFTLETKEEKEKIINYPISFLYNVFYHNNILFLLDSNNQLNVFKFDKDNLSIKKCVIEQRKNTNPKIIPLNIAKNQVKMILQKLEKIKENNLKEDYEILCDVLLRDLAIDLTIKNPKTFKDTLIFEIKDDKFLPKKYTCRIKQIKYQIDETGMIREKLTFAEGKTTFKEGIEFIMNYLKYKDKISINNTFKCPILFKNFEEKEIPPNKVIMCEIKSGFDVEELKRQLIERIEAMKYFIFNNGENPLYFIGIVNLDSNNVNKLTKYLDYNFEMKENILIATAVDFKYFDMDLSYEVDSGYLLFKRIGNIESKIDDLACTLCSINTKFENLTNEIKLIHPLHKFSYITQTEKNQNINNEEKKFDSL